MQVKLPLDPGVVLLDIGFTETDPNHGAPLASFPAQVLDACVRQRQGFAQFVAGLLVTLLESKGCRRMWAPPHVDYCMTCLHGRRLPAGQPRGRCWRPRTPPRVLSGSRVTSRFQVLSNLNLPCLGAGFLLGSRETMPETKDGGRIWTPPPPVVF